MEIPHGIMFHHFHSHKHPRGQGSISSKQFSAILNWLSERYVILNARNYASRLINGELCNNEICLTFDDALLCQIDVALPVLEQRGIEAFFFVYSSPFLGGIDALEIYRLFRTSKFSCVDDFYKEFFSEAQELIGDAYYRHQSDYGDSNFLRKFKFYSNDDRWFRYLRDVVLHADSYDNIMSSLMSYHHFDKKEAAKGLWMSNNDLRGLVGSGHVVGLHSTFHPTRMDLLSAHEQKQEYAQNIEHIEYATGERPFTMAHPCGRYNSSTLSVLDELKIKVGFGSSMDGTTLGRRRLEIPREDHANILAELNNT